MSNSTSSSHPVSSRQSEAFRRAMIDRLGVDEEMVVDGSVSTEWDPASEYAKVTLTVAVPTDEVIAMFNEAGKVSSPS